MKNISRLKRSYPFKRKNWGVFISRTVILIAFFLFVSGFVVNQSVVAQNEPQIKVGENSRSIKSGSETRPYLLYIPKGYDEKTALPLVLLFHGMGGAAKNVMALSDLSKVADEKKFIIAAPEGIYGNATWNYNQYRRYTNDVEFVKDLIKEIRSKMAIDQKRIFAAGWSAGAKMSCCLACELSDVIAAIGIVAGLEYFENCPSTRSVSIIAFHGTADPVISYSDPQDALSSWVKKNACTPTPKTRKISEAVTQLTYGDCRDNAEVVFYRIDEMGHAWPGSVYPDYVGKTNRDINASNLIWSFFEAHPLP